MHVVYSLKGDTVVHQGHISFEKENGISKHLRHTYDALF